MKKEELEQLIFEETVELLKDTELTLVDVEYVREKDWYLRIFIDKPGGVEIEDCQLVSETLTGFLDEKETIKDKYYLEVSSPGIDRPLKNNDDFLAYYDKKIDVLFLSEWEGMKELVGVLVSHTDDEIEVRKIIKGREFKKPVLISREIIKTIRPHIDF